MLEKFKIRLEEIKKMIDNQEDDYENQVLELEELVNQELEMLESRIRNIDFDKIDPLEEAFEKLEKIAEEIKKIKKENDFFDPEEELDRMFPNRHGEDFDEDSMSYDSVFGDD